MAYNLANSLSPMMFRKQKKSDQVGTRSERMRSKSVENILEAPGHKYQQKTDDTSACGKWKELDEVRRVHPVVTCVIPSLAMDFVASALLAVGATPLVTEDPADMEKDLSVCKAVIVDTSAPQVILEAFIDYYEVGCKPLILVASDCGTNDRKKDLALRITHESGPSFITGRLVDIFTLSMSQSEKALSQQCSSNSDNDDDASPPKPKVVLSEDKGGEEEPALDLSSLPPALRRRARMRRATSPVAVSPISTPPLRKSPNVSPRPSPPDSISNSPRNSPRTSPRSSPVPKRGIQKLLSRKRQANSDAALLKRVPTAIPRLKMKGQFRDTQSHDIMLEDAVEAAQKFAAHTTAVIHIYEANVVTSGEVIVEVSNTQLGMGNLHSTLCVCGAVVGAVLACVEEAGDEIELNNCVHALALYYVAAEEGAAATCQASERSVISPGTLRTKIIDALHHMQEEEVHSKAQIVAHTEGIRSIFNC